MFPSYDWTPDESTYEITLNVHFATRNFQEIEPLAAKMRKDGVRFTVRATVIVVKTALRMKKFEEALASFELLAVSWRQRRELLVTLSNAPSRS